MVVSFIPTFAFAGDEPSDQLDQINQIDQIDRGDQGEQTEQLDQVDRGEQIDRGEQGDQGDQDKQGDQGDRTEPTEWDLLAKALAGESQESLEGVFEVEGEGVLPFTTVTLLKDISAGDNDVVIGEDVFVDLNHFNITTSGKVTNDGCILLYQENAEVIDFLLYNAPGSYAANEELKLPTEENPDYIVPESTFLTSEVGTNPAYQELRLAIGDDPLVWNADVPAGMQLNVGYIIELGGDILGAKTGGIKTTSVTCNQLRLTDDIAIGNNNAGDGEAVLYVESLYDEDFGDDIGVFKANDKTITLNRTGEFKISADIEFDEAVLVSGVEGMEICKKENAEEKSVTYYLSTKNVFEDVDTDDFFYEPVIWALNNDITKGTDATHFSPALGVTRGQVVTFLWRAAGCPEPSGEAVTFADVPANQYYADAVAWAVEQKITNGTGEKTFSPDAVCTRGQIVTFLARFAGVKDAETESAFSDVKATDYFAAAVKWAKDNKVTEGTSATTFSPNAECTRGQVVTFLYRWMDK